MESSNSSLSTFSQSTCFYIFSLLICTVLKQLQYELLERHPTTTIEQNNIGMEDPLRGKPQGERFSVPQGWNNYLKRFDNDLSRGFQRPGNLCFRNTAILLLLHTPGLFNWLRAYMERHAPECRSSGECALCTLYELMGAYWSEDRFQEGHEKWMDILWKIVVKSSPEFSIGQHDVPEFLEVFLHKLLYNLTDVQHHADLDHMFKLINVANNACAQCETVGPSAELSYIALPGSFTDSRTSITVEDAIKNNLVNNSEMDVDCTKCSSTTALQCEQIASPPENLLVQVHRGVVQSKIQAQVQLKSNLTIPDELKTEKLKETGKLQYELYAVVFHMGDLASQGHYSIAVKGPNRAWVQIDDTNVTILQETELFASPQNCQDAYMLAYRRVPTATDWRKTKQVKPPYPLDSPQLMPPVGFQPQHLQLHGLNPGIMIDQRTGWIRIDQSILPKDASVPITYSNHCLLPARFEPKSQNVSMNLKLTLPTGEVLEGAGEILVSLDGDQNGIKPLFATTGIKKVNEQEIESPIPPKPKPVRKCKTARRTKRPKRKIKESSESDEAYEAPRTRRSKRIRR